MTNIDKYDCFYEIVMAKTNENTEWTKKLHNHVKIYSKNVNDKYHIPPNMCNDLGEGSTYLYHIINNYSNLSEWTLFLHAHETHWHHPYSVLKTSCMIDINKLPGHIKFLSVNHDCNGNILINNKNTNLQPFELSNDEYNQIMLDIFDETEYNELINEYFSNENKIIKQVYPMCGQFLVHKSRILSRPIEFYIKILNLLNDKHNKLFTRKAIKTTVFHKNKPISGFLLETLWHYIFKEDFIYNPPLSNINQFPFLVDISRNAKTI